MTTYLMKNVGSDRNGFEQLGNLYKEAISQDDPTVALDFSSVRWFDANMAAALGAVAYVLSKAGRAIKIFDAKPEVYNILARNGLLGKFQKTSRSTIIPLQQFQPKEARRFAAYTSDHMRLKGIPYMSGQLEKKFFEGIDELFANSAVHSKTKYGIFACGQLYPKKKRLIFSIVDLGIGFQRNIFDVLKLHLPPEDAIDWAMRGKNTTRSGDLPGGLGLKILKDFIRHNGGCLMIVSFRGYWCLHPDETQKGQIAYPFPGTAVTLEVDTSDTSIYYMEGEIDPDSVF